MVVQEDSEFTFALDTTNLHTKFIEPSCWERTDGLTEQLLHKKNRKHIENGKKNGDTDIKGILNTTL